MNCPQCGAILQEVAVPAKVGYLLALDQCRRCGGIWCDRWEAFALSAAGAADLDRVDAAALHAATPTPPVPVRCPRCQARMDEFHDPTVPPDAHIERCRNCAGMWFNRGELSRLKGPPGASARNASRHAAAVGAWRPTGAVASQPCPTVGNLDSAWEDSDGEDSAAELGAELGRGAVWIAARTLLHLLLHI